MKAKNILFVIIVLVVALFIAGLVLSSRNCFLKSPAGYLLKSGRNVYFCPMHPSFTSEKPGSCIICGMNLIQKKEAAPVPATKAGKEILYYRNPMNPEVTSTVPMKDQMGMDYVPVYAEETAVKDAGVYISPEKQQLIGVKQEKIEKRHLVYDIRTVGKVAYDPELYIAQQEYLQALKAKEATAGSSVVLVKQQMLSLAEAAEQRLLLLGMNKNQIQELVKEGKPQQNLYLPLDSDTVWIYMTIYEYEIGLIKEGLTVDIDAVAFPGEIFKGKVVAITPVLDAMTRSINIRAEVKNPEHKLKPEMFVNANIHVDLGEKLSVSESAVLDTGLRKIVYLVKEGNFLDSREVILGQKATGYYEVLQGLNAGDTVVTSGNFLVDSESRLKTASPSSQQ